MFFPPLTLFTQEFICPSVLFKGFFCHYFYVWTIYHGPCANGRMWVSRGGEHTCYPQIDTIITRDEPKNSVEYFNTCILKTNTCKAHAKSLNKYLTELKKISTTLYKWYIKSSLGTKLKFNDNQFQTSNLIGNNVIFV